MTVVSAPFSREREIISPFSPTSPTVIDFPDLRVSDGRNVLKVFTTIGFEANGMAAVPESSRMRAVRRASSLARCLQAQCRSVTNFSEPDSFKCLRSIPASCRTVQVLPGLQATLEERGFMLPIGTDSVRSLRSAARSHSGEQSAALRTSPHHAAKSIGVNPSSGFPSENVDFQDRLSRGPRARHSSG